MSFLRNVLWSHVDVLRSCGKRISLAGPECFNPSTSNSVTAEGKSCYYRYMWTKALTESHSAFVPPLRLAHHQEQRMGVLRYLALSAAATTSATNVFVSDYAGHLTSFALNEQPGNYSLTQISQSTDCAPNPSWLTLDADRGLLYCLNEGLETLNGSLSSFAINPNGSLTHVKSATTLSGPVNGVLYGPAAGQRGIALAHYAGSAVSTWLLDGDDGGFSLNQNVPFTLLHPGPDADRQDAPHEHQAILDPTGQYILVPDLGADLVRVFSYDRKTLKLKSLSPLQVAPGSGPRHAAFWTPCGVARDGCTTYLYLVAELASTVTGYAVGYLPDEAGLNFTQIYHSTTYGPLNLPPGNAPAGVQITVYLLLIPTAILHPS